MPDKKNEISKNLRARGYPEHLIAKGFKKVVGVRREKLLRDKTNRQDKRGIPMVITYSRHLPDIKKILHEKKRILARSNNLHNTLNSHMFVAYRRGTNLRDILVHKKTKRLARLDDKREGGCGKNCSVCKVMYRQQDRIRGPGGKHTCTCTYDKTIGCKSRNVIYGVFCEVCECVVYVGETGGVLYQRIQNHLSSIRCSRMDVGLHFNNVGHHLSNAKFVGLEKVWKNVVSYRRLREQRWIELFETHVRTGGLNKKTK